MSKMLGQRSTIVILVFALLLSQAANHIINANPNYFNKYTAIVMNGESISSMVIEQVYDTDNNLHLILILWFNNETYELLNYWNGHYAVIDTGVGYDVQIIEVMTLANGIGVLYIDADDYYYRVVKFYKWSETDEAISVVSSYRFDAYVTGIFADYFDGTINVFLITDPYYQNTNVTLSYIEIDSEDMNVSIIGEYILPMSSNYIIEGVYTSNDSLYIVSLQEKWVVTNYRSMILTQRLFPNNTIINCTAFILPEYSYPSFTFTRVEGAERSDCFYVVFSDMEKIHVKRVLISENQTFDGYASFLNSTNQKPIGYCSKPIIKAYENVSFIALYSIDYFVEATSNQNNNVKIVLFTEKDNSFIQSELTITLSGKLTNFQKWFDMMFVDQTGNFTASYAQTLDDSQFRAHYLAEEIIDLEVISSFALPEVEPIAISLKIMSDWEYFWHTNWPIFVGAISFMILIYVIFHKRINKFIRKIKQFLLRPIIDTKSKSMLILVNLWLFISGTIRLIWWLWISNKKRVIVSILGMAIIASTINLSILTTQSKFNSIVAAKVDSTLICNDWHPSVEWNFHLSSGSNFISLNSENWSDVVLNDIMSTLMEYAPTYASLIKGYYTVTSLSGMESFSQNHNDTVRWYGDIIGYTPEYSTLLSSLLEGRLPQKPAEIVISVDTHKAYGVKIGDNVTICTDIEKSKKYFNATVVGISLFESLIQFRALAQKLGLSGDIYLPLAQNCILVPVQYLGTIVQNIEPSPTHLKGRIQFVFDFPDRYSQSKAEQLVKDFETLASMNPVRFNFGDGDWDYIDELSKIVSELNYLLISSQSYMLVILVPLLYLGIFLITETSTLFRASYNKEIDLLSSKGLSLGRITMTYSLMKVLESIVAIFSSIAITILVLPKIVKIDTLLTFNDTFAEPSLDGLTAAITGSFVLLLFITMPDIVKLSLRKKRSIKEPKRFIRIVKKFQLLNLFYIVVGSLLCYLFFYLFDMFSFTAAMMNNLLLIVFQYLSATGLMLVFLGIGLMLKDLHKLILMLLSKVIWKLRKSKRTILIVNIRSDIDLFSKNFLTWMLIIWLIVPSLLFPIYIQHQMINVAKFYHNADIIILDTCFTSQTRIQETLNETEVELWTTVKVFNVSYNTFRFTVEVIEDIDAYQKIAYVPPEDYVNNWNQSLDTLSENNTMLVSERYLLYVACRKPEITFGNITFNITGTFKQFPGYQIKSNLAVVTSLKNFLTLMKILINVHAINTRILIKLKNSADQESFATKIKEKHGISITSFEGYYHGLLNDAIPAYPLMATEYVLTILMCLITVLFISITTPLKTLLYRINKHDILKKIGISTHTIVFQTIVEYVIASLFIGIVIGYIGAKIMLHYMKKFWVMAIGNLSFDIHDPIWTTLLIFVVFPLLFIGVFAVTMANNFRKYRPINLE